MSDHTIRVDGGAVTDSNGHRLGVVDDRSRGTEAVAWAGWSASVEPLDPGRGGWDDVVVVAPHPDDEVLGVGGLLRRLSSRGARVRVVAVTDGDGAPPPRGWSADRLAAARVDEAVAACAEVGVETPLRLRVPDGDVAGHEAFVRNQLLQLLDASTVCLATWREDGHPDHEATGRAAAAACAQSGARLVEFPVWMWHWARPGDPAVPWPRVRAMHLTPAELTAKRRAVQRHRTQLEPPSVGVDPVLPPFVLDRLVTDHEMLIV